MYSRILKKIESIMVKLTGLLFFCILCITVTNIVLRNVLGVSWLFMDGLLRLMFIWMVFLGSSILFYRNDHLIMNFFSDKFSDRAFVIVDMLQHVLFLLFMGILVYYGIHVTSIRMTIPFETWDLPTGYAYMSVPVNAVIMALFAVEKIIYLKESNK
ncbi:MAG: TRAP transporter small permease [Sphaerochaetaceae bacterium]